MIWFIIIALILLLILFFFLLYRRKEPCIHFYEGSLGLGKTLLCVKEGKRLYKKNVAKWRREMRKRRRYGRIHNLDVEYLDPPKLVTNVELYLSKYKYAERFSDDLWTKKLPNGSVCIFDEVGNIKGLSQNDSGKSLMNNVFDEYFRYFRQDSKGGYIVCNDQAFSNCNNVFRRRVNVINKIDAFKIFLCFGFVTFRVYDVINDEQRPRLDKKGRQVVKTKICILKKGEYDTYAHYEKSKDKILFVSDYIIPVSRSAVSGKHISINNKNTKKSDALLVTNSYTYTETPFSPTRVYYVKRGDNYYFATINGLVLTLNVTTLDSRYIVYPVVKYYYGDPSSSTEADSFVSYPIYNDSSPSYDGYAFPSGVVVDAFALTILGIGNNTIKFTFSTATHVGNKFPSFTYSSEVNIVLDKSSNPSANTALYQFLITAYPSTYYWNLVSVPTSYGIGTYEQGYAQGQSDAIAANKDTWYNNGYNAGINANLEEELGPLLVDETISAIITAPVNFIKQVFNFDLFGFNVGGIFFGIATITLLIAAFGIIKKVVK